MILICWGLRRAALAALGWLRRRYVAGLAVRSDTLGSSPPLRGELLPSASALRAPLHIASPRTRRKYRHHNFRTIHLHDKCVCKVIDALVVPFCPFIFISSPTFR